MSDFYEQLQGIAEGSLKCDCGNQDWKQFIFVASGEEFVVAGCKKCGCIFMHRNGNWEITVPLK